MVKAGELVFLYCTLLRVLDITALVDYLMSYVMKQIIIKYILDCCNGTLTLLNKWLKVDLRISCVT